MVGVKVNACNGCGRSLLRGYCDLDCPERIRKEGEVRAKEDVRSKRHRLFNVLWTKAVGTPGYDKAEWLELERLMSANDP